MMCRSETFEGLDQTSLYDKRATTPRLGRFIARSSTVVLLLALGTMLSSCASAPRLVDSEEATGFAIYRSGRLSVRELESLCRVGVEEIVVLDGSAAGRECRELPLHCPGLAVRYDEAQDADVALDAAFLRAFDAWVEQAQSNGKKIAFRCTYGWHRAGRLAAYYEMKYTGSELEEARDRMNKLGKFMATHPGLQQQVVALHDHILGRDCSVSVTHCVRRDSKEIDSAPPHQFAGNACP